MARRSNGMGCLIDKGAGKPFLAKWVYGGQTFYKSTGETNRAKAEIALEKLTRPYREQSQIEVEENVLAKVRVAQGKLKQTEMQEAGIKLTDLFQKFKADISTADIKQNTIKSYDNAYNKFMEWLGENHKYLTLMKYIDDRICLEYMSYLAKVISVNVWRNRLLFFIRLWNMFGHEGRCLENPWLKVPMRKGVTKSNRKTLTLEQLKMLIDEAGKYGSKSKGGKNWNKDRGKELVCLFSLGYYTGMAIEDCCLLKWEHLHFDIMQLKKERIKTEKFEGTEIDIAIHPELAKIIQSIPHQEGEEYVLPWCAVSYRNRSIKYAIKRIFDNCGIKTSEECGNGRRKIISGFHCLRRLFVSINMSNPNVNPFLISKMVSHTSLKTTDIYWDVNKNQIRKAIEEMPVVSNVGVKKNEDMVTIPRQEYYDLLKIKKDLESEKEKIKKMKEDLEKRMMILHEREMSLMILTAKKKK